MPMTPGPAEPLFLPGWEVEPCDTAPAPAHIRRRTYNPLCLRDTVTVPIPIDHYPEGAAPCATARRPSSNSSSSPTAPNEDH